MKNKKHKLETIQLLIIGFYLTSEGYDILSEYALFGGIILSFGVMLLTYFVYSLIKKRHNKTLNLLVHLFEAVALLFTAYVLYKEKKLALQYVTLLASIGSFITVIIIFLKQKHSPTIENKSRMKIRQEH